MNTDAGGLRRRITFRQPTTDGDGEASGYADVVTRDARVTPKVGGEEVQASRMAGHQPVVITVRREVALKYLNNGWQAVDARALADSPPVTIAWDIASVFTTEDQRWIECLAVQRLGGDVS